MYIGRGQFGAGARTRYQSVDLASRIEGASPHRLVGVLFEELLKTLEAMAAACRRGDIPQRNLRQSSALSILHGLEGSLDFDQGGEVAQSLALVYREARRLVMEGGRGSDDGAVERARSMLAEIATAWEAIG